MNEKSPSFFLRHIVESIELIKEFSEDLTKTELEKNKLKQSAIIRQIEIIGEAVKNLPIDFTSKYPFVSWSEIARARDKIVHHYFGIDLNIIWNIIEIQLPELKKDIEEIIKKEERKNEK